MPFIDFRGDKLAYEDALKEQSDIVETSKKHDATQRFIHILQTRLCDIEHLILHHLRLPRTFACQFYDEKQWIRGGFNVLIPTNVVRADGTLERQVIMRCSMPHAVGIGTNSSLVDEKLRCEIATYVHIQEEENGKEKEDSPSIPLVHLYGYGLSTGRSVSILGYHQVHTDLTQYTHSARLPMITKIVHQFRRWILTLLSKPVPCQYGWNPCFTSFKIGYMLLERVDPAEGKMFSTSIPWYTNDITKRRNFFRSLADINLSLSRTPCPRIGALTIFDDSTIDLSNRPLSCHLAILESRGSPKIISQNQTYDVVEPYISDLLAYQESRFRRQLNAVEERSDCQAQMAAGIIMRAIVHHFLPLENQRHGPFHLTFTDTNPSNLFVAEDGRIVKICDMEWICSLPISMQCAPHWLTGRGIDEIDNDDQLRHYEAALKEYLEVFAEQERNHFSSDHLSEALRLNWERKAFWITHALTSIDAMYNIFDHHLRPLFYSPLIPSSTDRIISRFYALDASALEDQKIKDASRFEDEVRKAYGQTNQ